MPTADERTPRPDVRLRILFVDDEVAVLDGLRRTLRPLRRQWDVQTAQGGAAALHLLAAGPVDVVVTDMRMPGMDGLELLESVRAAYPHVVRIVLSGHSEQEALLRTVGPVHQYLDKPCDTTLLAAAIARSHALRRDLRSSAGDAPLLSAATGTSHRILIPDETGGSPHERLDACLGGRPELGERLRRLRRLRPGVARGEATTTSGLVQDLGADLVRMAVVLDDVLQGSPRAARAGMDLAGFIARGHAVAHLAEAIAMAERQPADQCRMAFLAGLIHDCGVVVLAHHDPEAYARVLAALRESRQDLESAESAHCVTTHTLAGARLLARWGLPDSYVEIALRHHRPAEGAAGAFSPLSAVHIADALVDQPAAGNREPAGEHWDENHLARLGLAGRRQDWRALRDGVLDRIARA